MTGPLITKYTHMVGPENDAIRILRGEPINKGKESLGRMESLVSSGYGVDTLYQGVLPIFVTAMNTQRIAHYPI